MDGFVEAARFWPIRFRPCPPNHLLVLMIKVGDVLPSYQPKGEHNYQRRCMSLDLETWTCRSCKLNSNRCMFLIKWCAAYRSRLSNKNRSGSVLVEKRSKFFKVKPLFVVRSSVLIRMILDHCKTRSQFMIDGIETAIYDTLNVHTSRSSS